MLYLAAALLEFVSMPLDVMCFPCDDTAHRSETKTACDCRNLHRHYASPKTTLTAGAQAELLPYFVLIN